MKFIFALLLSLNLLLYGAWQGWLGSGFKRWVAWSEAEPGRWAQQISPERLQVLNPAPAGQVALTLTPQLAPPASAAAVAAVTPAASAPAVVAAVSGALSCVELGAFNLNDAQALSSKLRASGFSRVDQRLAAPVNGFLVYLPNESRAARDKKMPEIRAKNETDIAVLQENSPLSHAISLGIFGTQEAATARVVALSKKGITGTRVIQRGEKSPRSFVQVLGLEEVQRDRLETLTQETGLSWRSCGSETSATR